MATRKKSSDPLKTLFPGDEIELSTGGKLVIRPLCLEDIPKVTDSLAHLFDKFQRFREEQKQAEDSGSDEIPSNIELLKIGMREIINLIPFCCSMDGSPVELSKVPVTALPLILNKIVEQNFTDDSIKNWVALIKKVTGFVPAGEKKDQSGVENISPDKSLSE